ncbi:hypothetical protein VTO42DRAFT_840 [Malbranchea cinnamomea]
MSPPKPPVDLKGHCSVLHENTLYVYTPEAFLSLKLERDAEWERLDMGQSVTGAVCVKGGLNGNPHEPVLYLVGGTSDNPEYRGLQRYSFADQRWETMVPPTWDLQNRVRHGAIYINSAASLLVYSGTQNGDSNPSSQTFLVSAAPPYNIESFTSPFMPSLDPILVPWNEDSAAMIGAGTERKDVFTFGGGQWTQVNTALPDPLPDPSVVQCATVHTNDGSEIVQIFDMGSSPNTVTEYVLSAPGRDALDPGTTPGSLSYAKLRRQVSLANYPPYNGTLASKSPRTGFSLAQDSDGQVVISGGGEEDEPILVFDQNENSWVDTDELFGSPTTTSTVSSSTITATSTSTTSFETTTVAATSTSSATASATTSALPPPAEGDNSNTLTIIGATLGAILGVAAILIIILLILAWKKRRSKYPGQNGSGSDDPDRLSFQDQGMEPLTRSMQPMGRATAPSTDSWAIVSGQANAGPRVLPPSTSFNGLNFGIEKKASPLRNVETNSPDDSFAKEIAVPGVAVVSHGKRDSVRNDRLTDEGWSKYFQGDNDSPPNRSRSMRSTVSSLESKSDYGGSGWPQASAEVPALSLRTLNEPQPIRHIPSGSPSTEHAPNFDNLVAHQGMSAKISSADSISIASDESPEDPKDAFSSGVPASIPDDSDWRRSRLTIERVPSSQYSGSMYFQGASGADTPGNRMTQWPGQQPQSQEETWNQQGYLSSDISWLNLGGNR